MVGYGDRMGTKDWLYQWSGTSSHLCLLSVGTVELHDVLFFKCPFGFEVWARI